jgi:hypothetical protein
VGEAGCSGGDVSRAVSEAVGLDSAVGEALACWRLPSSAQFPSLSPFPFLFFFWFELLVTAFGYTIPPKLLGLFSLPDYYQQKAFSWNGLRTKTNGKF